MRMLLAILMILHGVAHLPGFVNEWRLADLKGLPYRTTILGGRVDLGDAGIRVVGLLWLAAAVAFLVAGMAAAWSASWWMRAGAGVAVGSLLLNMVELPEARIGVAVNVLILAALAVTWRLAAG